MLLNTRQLLPAVALIFMSLQWAGAQTPVNTQSTKRTKALLSNLSHTTGNGYILFGQEDALAYGVGWKNKPGFSDIKSVCGDYPAVYGWDLCNIGLLPFNIDTVRFDSMRLWIRQAYRRGGIHSFSWHLRNPKTGGSSWDTTAAVADILPGGPLHDFYKSQLDYVADYLGNLKTGFPFSHRIPVIFRPFHEQNGGWFWWGKPHCTPEEYKALYRFTFHYLTEVKKLNNVLFAYSPDVFETEADYLLYYPGDEYVDVMGLDMYHFTSRTLDTMMHKLGAVVRLAESRKKVAALTETGYEKIPDAQWWTYQLLQPMLSDPDAHRVAYVMVWRNAWPSHHYGPYPGHPSAPNFVAFANDARIFMERDLPRMYRLPKKAKTRKTPAK
ncbi:MAG: beta-mannosidase [Saprospiraceae bacterium]|nr:beta-mannosidase [Saprospiraceae bacterium]